MTSNDNDMRKMEEEEGESSTVRKRLQHTDDDGGDSDSSDIPEEEPSEEEEEMEEEVSLMNQLDTFEEKLYARCTCDIHFSDDRDTPSTLSHHPH
jgi:hypothetical protein